MLANRRVEPRRIGLEAGDVIAGLLFLLACSLVMARGLACRVPNRRALDTIWSQVARVVDVSDAEIAQAMRAYYQDTHNLAEGAGAAALAGALREKENLQGKRIGVVLTGGNVDWETYLEALARNL